MYTSKHYTCEEIDQRLLQGYYDDFVKAGFVGTIKDFWTLVLSIANKVDAKEGYGLSQNDFTNELKAKLDTLTSISKVSDLENDLDFQTAEQVKNSIDELINGSGEALDTLKELAEALNNDPDFATNVLNKINEVNNKIDTNVSRIDEETSNLSSEIHNVKDYADNIVNQLSGEVNPKIASLQTSVEGIKESQADIKNDINSLQAEDTKLHNDISDIQLDLQGKADTSVTDELSETLDNLIQDHIQYEAKVDTKLANESIKRDEADNQIKESINQLKVDHGSDISKVSQDLQTETTERSKADSTLQSSINEEVNKRSSEVIRLEGLISSETTNRTSQDQLLSHSISDTNDDISRKYTELKSSIELEVSNRQNADSLLVPKKEGYSLSKNDFTDELKAKLDGIEVGAKNITKVSELENDSDFQTSEEVNAAIEKIIGAAPEVLDTLKELADALDNDPDFANNITKRITELASQVNKEVQDRKAADQSIVDQVNPELEALKEKDNTNFNILEGKISDERIAREAADKVLTNTINTEVESRKSEDALIKQSFDTYTHTFTTQISSFNSSLDKVRSDLSAEIQSKSEMITTNVGNIQRNLELIQGLQETVGDNYTLLKEKIDLEISNRQEADNSLGTKVTSLETSLNQEIEDRNNAINEEKNLRESEDRALDEKIDNEIADLQTQITALQEALAQEVANRESAINDILESLGWKPNV